MALEHFSHDLRFAASQYAVVDENAGKLLTDGLVQPGRGDA